MTYLLANGTNLTEDTLILPKENRISELHLRATKISRIQLHHFDQLSICRLSGLQQDSLDTINNKQLVQLELSNCKIKRVDLKSSHLLSDFTANDSSFEEIICNEFQALTIPFLSKQFNLKPNEGQLKILETLKLHKQAIKHNWDDSFNKLKKILKNPNCDKATATLIYWLGAPNYFLKYNKVSEAKKHEQEKFRFLNKLEKQLLYGDFKTTIIDFNPADFMGTNWVLNSFDAQRAVREIASSLKKNIKGNKVVAFNLDKEYIGKL